MMISRSYGVTKRLRSRRRTVRKEEPMEAEEAVSLPVVAKECDDCKTTTTPLWRCGPGGPKSLCNACGIKFSKSRTKSEPEAECSEKGSNETWEELKRQQKEKQQKLLLILLQQQRNKAKNRKQVSTISRSTAASAFGEAKKKKRSIRGIDGGKGDREVEAAALLLLSLSSASASASYS